MRPILPLSGSPHAHTLVALPSVVRAQLWSKPEAILMSLRLPFEKASAPNYIGVLMPSLIFPWTELR